MGLSPGSSAPHRRFPHSQEVASGPPCCWAHAPMQVPTGPGHASRLPLPVCLCPGPSPGQWQESLSLLVSVLCAVSGGPTWPSYSCSREAPAYAPALGSGTPSSSQECLSIYAPPCTCEGVAECTLRAGKQGCLHLLAPGHVTGFCEDHTCSGGQEGWRCHPGNMGRRRKGRVQTVGAPCAGWGDRGSPMETAWAGLSRGGYDRAHLAAV